MNRPKRQHFVPQMILRRFTDEGGRLYVFNKRFPDRGVVTSTPTNVFVEHDLYTQRDRHGEKDYSVESKLAILEGPAAKTIEKIVKAARMGQSPNLTPSEKTNWDEYIYYQWRRVPDMHDSIYPYTEFEANVYEMLEEYEATIRPLTAEERSAVLEPKEIARIRQNARANVIARRAEEPVRILGQKGLVVAKIENPRKSFVIGSHPIVKLTYPGRAHLSDPSVEVWFPLAHDVAVTPGLARGTERLIVLEKGSDIRYLNEAIFKQSTAIAGRSRTLVASLAGAR